MYDRGRLKGMTGTLALHEAIGEPLQFVVHQGSQSIERIGLPGTPVPQELGH